MPRLLGRLTSLIRIQSESLICQWLIPRFYMILVKGDQSKWVYKIDSKTRINSHTRFRLIARSRINENIETASSLFSTNSSRRTQISVINISDPFYKYQLFMSILRLFFETERIGSRVLKPYFPIYRRF